MENTINQIQNALEANARDSTRARTLIGKITNPNYRWKMSEITEFFSLLAVRRLGSQVVLEGEPSAPTNLATVLRYPEQHGINMKEQVLVVALPSTISEVNGGGLQDVMTISYAGDVQEEHTEVHSNDGLDNQIMRLFIKLVAAFHIVEERGAEMAAEADALIEPTEETDVITTSRFLVNFERVHLERVPRTLLKFGPFSLLKMDEIQAILASNEEA